MKDLGLIGLCGALAAGEASGFLLSDWFALWPLVAGAALLFGCFGYGLAWRGWRYAFTALLGLALALAASARRADVVRGALENRGNLPLVAELEVREGVQTHAGRGDRAWVSFPSEMNGLPVKVMMPVPESGELPLAGERWRCAGRFAHGEQPNPWRRRTFWVSGKGTLAVRVATVAADSWPARFARVRKDFSRRVAIGLDHNPRAADLNRAILLGERRRVDRESRDLFVSAGTMHVFAISGLHVMVVAQVFLYLLLVLFIPVRFMGVALIPCLWGYVLLTGAAPSAVRAATMASIYFAAPLFWRKSDGLVAWAFTYLIVHVISPELVFDVGAVLSFTVVFSLLLWVRYSRDFSRRWVANLGLAAVAWAAGVPIAAHVFGRVTPGGLLANLALIPAASVSVASGVLGILASFVSETLAAHINNLSALFTDLMVGISHAVAHLPGANFEVRPWNLWTCFAWYAVIVLSLYLIRSVSRRRL